MEKMHDAYCLIRNMCHQLQHAYYQIPCICYQIQTYMCTNTINWPFVSPYMTPNTLCISSAKLYIRHMYMPRILMIQLVASVYRHMWTYTSRLVEISGRLCIIRDMCMQRILMSIHKCSVYWWICMYMHWWFANTPEYSGIFMYTHVSENFHENMMILTYVYKSPWIWSKESWISIFSALYSLILMNIHVYAANIHEYS